MAQNNSFHGPIISYRRLNGGKMNIRRRTTHGRTVHTQQRELTKKARGGEQV